ncbi:MAG: carboxypeptidase-like regulatory domain-containing protein [Taibaiella sp.]|nr:carboxypeptidase-like regulatory domain-containing protein [Taibaiella sp.]
MRLLFVFLALAARLASLGQVVKGVVLDSEHEQPVVNASVVNKKTGAVALSDADGHFSIIAERGHVLTFSHMSFEAGTVIVAVDDGQRMVVKLVPNEVMLQRVIISSRTKYQRDSAERHEMYGHELTRPLTPKPRYTGLGCSGCFGWLADKITGNGKQAKKFRKGFVSDDEVKFIDSRYNLEVVALLIDLKDPDSIATFINHYPMEYDFARAATELELKAWVRANYREYRLHR